MEKLAYGILIAITLIWILTILYGFISIFPIGIIGILVIVAFGLLFIKVLKEKFEKKEENEKFKDIKW